MQVLCKAGQVDLALPLYFKDELSTIFGFSDSFPGGNIGFLKRIDKEIKIPENISNQSDLLQELTDYSIGVRSGVNITGDSDKVVFFKEISAMTDTQTLMMLNGKRFDLLLIDKYSAAYIMSTSMPQLIGNLEFIEPPFEKKEFYAAFSKKKGNYSEILDIFNLGLQKLKINGRLKEILYAHGFYDLTEVEKLDSDKIKLTIGSVDNGDMVVMQKLSPNHS